MKSGTTYLKEEVQNKLEEYTSDEINTVTVSLIITESLFPKFDVDVNNEL